MVDVVLLILGTITIPGVGTFDAGSSVTSAVESYYVPATEDVILVGRDASGGVSQVVIYQENTVAQLGAVVSSTKVKASPIESRQVITEDDVVYESAPISSAADVECGRVTYRWKFNEMQCKDPASGGPTVKRSDSSTVFLSGQDATDFVDDLGLL